MEQQHSKDPLENLPSDLYDLVFQHIPPLHLLSLSSVSTLWYSIIGESPSAMKKLKITLTHLNSLGMKAPEKNLSSLFTSRQYRNIYADFSEHKHQDILKVLEPEKRRWRNVHLLNASLESGKFFDFFQETVENLTLARINCDILEEERKEAKSFINLKCLKIFSCNANLMKNLDKCSNLTELHVSESETSGQRPEREIMEKLLTNNKDLENLSIFSHTAEILLPKQIKARLPFRLKKLVIDSFKEFSSADVRERLVEFLKSQAGSLSILDINPYVGLETIQVCFDMPKLRDFTFNVMNREENIEWNRINLNENESVERLHLRDVSPRESTILYDLLFSKTPNLRVYKARFVHLEDLALLSAKCRKLEELYVENFDVSVLPNDGCLPKLKKFKSWDINEDLVKSLRNKGAKNDFEKLVIDQFEN